MEHKVSINNNSVDFSGITKDYREAISELIWNGFDAGAKSVNLVFDANEIDFISSIEIVDDGTGINLESLGQTFGSFLDSLKRGFGQRSSYVRGKKGKGRFSFIAFAQSAVWNTTYREESSGKYISYQVNINAANKDYYRDEDKKIEIASTTGTSLKLSDLFGVTAYSFSSETFIDYLKHEFGWFLLLNSKHEYQLCINGVAIQYADILADHEVFRKEFEDASISRFNFTITFVRWNEKIGDKFYYYFLNGEKKEVFKQLTSFNNNAINFYHSVYVESEYFNNFDCSDNEYSERLFGSNPQSPIFKQLIKELQKIVNHKQKEFIRENAADEFIKKIELNNTIPVFALGREDQKLEFISLLRELYCVHPRIFKGLNEHQERFTFGLINILFTGGHHNELLEFLIRQGGIDHEEHANLYNLLNNQNC